jgi:hypothetical protein
MKPGLPDFTTSVNLCLVYSLTGHLLALVEIGLKRRPVEIQRPESMLARGLPAEIQSRQNFPIFYPFNFSITYISPRHFLAVTATYSKLMNTTNRPSYLPVRAFFGRVQCIVIIGFYGR